MHKNKKISLRGIVFAALFAGLIAIGTFIKIPIPFLPFTLQTLFTMLAALLLGSKYGTLSVITYVAVGLLGLPIFTGGGGFTAILMPSFGYLLGFIAGTFVAGKILEKRKTKDMKTFLISCFSNTAIVYVFGLIYYYFISNYYLKSPLSVGILMLHCFLMTLPGDILKCILASFLAKRLLPTIKFK